MKAAYSDIILRDECYLNIKAIFSVRQALPFLMMQVSLSAGRNMMSSEGSFHSWGGRHSFPEWDVNIR